MCPKAAKKYANNQAPKTATIHSPLDVQQASTTPLEIIPDLDDELHSSDTSLVVGEIQLILAEKRTSLAVLRTGIGIAVIPLSLTTVLVTLSRYYSWVENLHFLIPMLVISVGLIGLATYLVQRSIVRIRFYDNLVYRIRQANPTLKKFIFSSTVSDRLIPH